MIKRTIRCLFACAVLVLLLSSCTTTVSVMNHVPAEVNMSRMKNLAVASVNVADDVAARSPVVKVVGSFSGADSRIRVFTGWSSLIPGNLGKYAQGILLEKMGNTDYFKISMPADTDALFSTGKMLGKTRQLFIDAGIDAILSSRLSILSYNEYITSRERISYDSALGKNVVVGIDYYLETSMVIGFEYNVVGVEQNRLVTSRNYTRTVENETLAATFLYGSSGMSDGKLSFVINSAPVLTSEYREAISQMVSQVAEDLAPRWERAYEPLMKNRAKIKSLDEAYKMADAGNYHTACRIFLDCWESRKDLAAGYNAAILMYAKGDLEDAIALMREVVETTGYSKAWDKLKQLEKTLEQWRLADLQMSEAPVAADAMVEEFEIRNFFGR